MAGDWIKMRGNLWDDPRVSRLVDMTDSTEAAVVGALYWLWSTADQHTEDGVMIGLTPRAIDRKTGVKGLGDALVAIGWIADHPEGIRIVNFEEHNGASAKKRCQTAKRVANHAAANAQSREDIEDVNAELTQQALAEREPSVKRALAREEKRREEEIPPLPPTGGGACRFEEFWAAWPKGERKQDKVKCAQKWKRSGLDLVADLILGDIGVKRTTEKWGAGFIEAPLVYLNGRRWEDGAGAEAQADQWAGAI